ncbi:MAG: hypothetical protein AAF985_18355 [Bacteroidota bacterium]
MKQLGKLIRDIVPVILGILVALVINNWNEDRKDKNYLDRIFISIENELEASRIDIKEKIPKQQVLIDSLKRYMSDETVSMFAIIRKADGIHGPLIKNSSWKAIASTKIELIEFEKLSTLSEIDASKKNLELKQEKLMDFMINNIKSTSQEKKEVLMLLMQEIISTEKYLYRELDAFLQQSKEETPKE